MRPDGGKVESGECLVLTLVQAVHDRLGIVEVIEAKRVAELVRQNLHELLSRVELIDIDRLALRGDPVDAFIEFSAARFADLVERLHVQVEGRRLAIQDDDERVQFLDIGVEFIFHPPYLRDLRPELSLLEKEAVILFAFRTAPRIHSRDFLVIRILLLRERRDCRVITGSLRFVTRFERIVRRPAPVDRETERAKLLGGLLTIVVYQMYLERSVGTTRKKFFLDRLFPHRLRLENGGKKVLLRKAETRIQSGDRISDRPATGELCSNEP